MQSIDFEKYNLGELSDYIISTHHTYVKRSVPVILNLLEKESFSSRDMIREIQILFKELSELLLLHMEKEESILFPFIHKLVDLKSGVDNEGIPLISLVRSPLERCKKEHKLHLSFMTEIRVLTNNFTIQYDKSDNTIILYTELKQFEEDLITHILLENNILFPKMAELEQELLLRAA